MQKRILLISAFLVLLIYIACQTKIKDEYTIDMSKPVWQDEFDKDGLPDAQKWGYDIGGNGWGNNEKQFYTKDTKNARVENGNLIIEVHKEKHNNNDYTSARLTSKGKGDFLYGRFEIKAKLPKGRGTWPAAWMLATEQTYGTKYWPDNGEIDIIEHVGYDQNRVHGNVHTKAFNHVIGTNKGNNILVEGVSDGFHVYACEWLPDKISIEIDGNKYFTFNRIEGWEQWPYDKKFHLLLNVAIGGNWGGQKGIDDTIFPLRMEVDYVRIFQAVKK